MNSLKIGIPKRKEFAIDGDESRVISIDTSDIAIISRWREFETWALAATEGIEVPTEDQSEDTAALRTFTDVFTGLDGEMRSHLNALFDADVCTPIAGNGSVMRPMNGVALWELILNAIIPLYEKDISKEIEKSRARMDKHLAKYAK